MSLFPSAYWFGLILWGVILAIGISGITMMGYHFYLELKLKLLKYQLRKLRENRDSYERMLTVDELAELNNSNE